MVTSLALKLIRFYQKWMSFDQGKLSKIGLRMCRFTPTCSEYTYQAIEKYGMVRGSAKGLYRIMRCNPFNHGGHDPLK